MRAFAASQHQRQRRRQRQHRAPPQAHLYGAPGGAGALGPPINDGQLLRVVAAAGIGGAGREEVGVPGPKGVASGRGGAGDPLYLDFPARSQQQRPQPPEDPPLVRVRSANGPAGLYELKAVGNPAEVCVAVSHLKNCLLPLQLRLLCPVSVGYQCTTECTRGRCCASVARRSPSGGPFCPLPRSP